MPSHSLDPNDPNNVARILACIVMEHGGELRLKAATYDSYENARFLIYDYDRLSNEIVLRTTSNFGRAIAVKAENAAWLRNPEEVNRPTITAQQNVRQRIHRSDEELADLEMNRNREATLAREAAEGRVHFRTEAHPAAGAPRTMTGLTDEEPA